MTEWAHVSIPLEMRRRADQLIRDPRVQARWGFTSANEAVKHATGKLIEEMEAYVKAAAAAGSKLGQDP